MKLSTLFAAALLAAPALAGATTIADGSFEIKGAATPGLSDYCYDSFSAGGRPLCAASTWTGGGVIVSGAGPWGGTTTTFGNYYGFVQGNSVVSTTFTATATTQQILNWADANRTNNGGLQSYTVTLSDGVTTADLGTYASAFGGFVTKSTSPFLLVAGTAYTLSFTGVFSDDRTSFIDNVGLTAVPEASTWVMLLAGFGMIGFAARRRAAVTA